MKYTAYVTMTLEYDDISFDSPAQVIVTIVNEISHIDILRDSDSGVELKGMDVHVNKESDLETE